MVSGIELKLTSTLSNGLNLNPITEQVKYDEEHNNVDPFSYLRNMPKEHLNLTSDLPDLSDYSSNFLMQSYNPSLNKLDFRADYLSAFESNNSCYKK